METTQKKKLTILSILGLSSLSLIVSAAFLGKAGIIKPMNATDCDHTSIEHYSGFSDAGTGSGYVEHWACCQCHTAWADEARTIVLGNTIEDRSKLNTEVGFSYDWGAFMITPTYDSTNERALYSTSRFYIAENHEGDPYVLIETKSKRSLEEGYESIKFHILNDTSADTLNVQFLKGKSGEDWADIGFGVIPFEKGISKAVEFSADLWNYKIADSSSGPCFLIKNPNKDEVTGSFSIGVEFVKFEEKVITNCAITSNYNGWAEFTTTEDTDTFGRVVVADLSEITVGGQFVYNGVQPVDPSLYSKVHFGIYNPTSNTINANMRTVTSGWATLLYQEVKTIVPGWNDIYVNPDILSYHDVNMITVDISDYTQWKASGWKLSQFIGKLASQTRLSSLAISSDVTGEWKYFNEKRMDETFGEVTVCDLSSATGKFALVWNSCPIHTVGEYDRYYFAINNPTENTFSEISFNAADKDWGTLMTKYHITIEPGWNKISLPAAFFEVAGLSMYSINISADMGPQWANAGWEISNFFGLK